MWYRVLSIACSETEWQPAWALRIQGDGDFVRTTDGGSRLTFHSIEDAVAWVRQYRHGTFVELPYTRPDKEED